MSKAGFFVTYSRRKLRSGSGPRLVWAIFLAGASICLPHQGRAAGIGAPSIEPVARPNVAEQYLLDAANSERIGRGLKPLRRDANLSQAARYHAQQMALHGDISHRFPDEPDLTQRGSKAGARFSRISENVAEAPTSAMIHDLWMRSSGHRKNLLDPDVDAVGIAVVTRGAQTYAVEDFASSVQTLSYDEQERIVSDALARQGLSVGPDRLTSSLEDARRTCNAQTGYGGTSRKPRYIIRFTSSSLNELPLVLQKKIESGQYRKAVVGACRDAGTGSFTDYNIAVLLYP